ncbi:TPA: antibiotic biosynthesis monooxygenase [Candidatus Poribacteria bacterium]|mgnify:FL=1|jgi:quinol monooxygenase YgiN|nr:antibiotic biosynthesis monooxygenase [Candidatus Poribacteria bacterium]
MPYTVSAILRVKKRYLKEFNKRIRQHARNSVTKEPGCISFEVSVADSNPQKFLLYEVYIDEDAFKTHTEMPFMIKHLKETAVMMDGDLELLSFWSRVIAPAK